MYSSVAAMESGIASVKKNAPAARVEDTTAASSRFGRITERRPDNCTDLHDHIHKPYKRCGFSSQPQEPVFTRERQRDAARVPARRL